MMTATHSSSPYTTKACNGLRPSLGFHWFIYPSLTTYQSFDSIMWRIKKQFWYFMCIMAYMIYTYIAPKHDSGRPVIYKWATSYLCLINQRADVLWILQFLNSQLFYWYKPQKVHIKMLIFSTELWALFVICTSSIIYINVFRKKEKLKTINVGHWQILISC